MQSAHRCGHIDGLLPIRLAGNVMVDKPGSVTQFPRQRLTLFIQDIGDNDAGAFPDE